jgi:hypothetical protein
MDPGSFYIPREWVRTATGPCGLRRPRRRAVPASLHVLGDAVEVADDLVAQRLRAAIVPTAGDPPSREWIPPGWGGNVGDRLDPSQVSRSTSAARDYALYSQGAQRSRAADLR